MSAARDKLIEQAKIVHESELIFPDPTNASKRCCEDCPGWDVFNGDQIQSCDDCDVFETDGQAIAHVVQTILRDADEAAISSRIPLPAELAGLSEAELIALLVRNDEEGA